MPTKEIKELRQSGKLDEALAMARAELQADPGNIWSKRNLSWVYYELLKKSNSPHQFEEFHAWLEELSKLELTAEETMLFDNLCWQVGKMLFGLIKENPHDSSRELRLWNLVRSYPFPKPSVGYSFLFKAFHKSLKETDRYLEFADWWGFEHFMPADYEKEKLPDGKELMSIVEQAYIAYAKHLLPRQSLQGQVHFDRSKAESFLPAITELIEKHPQYQYPAYFMAKLLLALGDKGNMLQYLLPFAKRKRNDFWVWDILAEAFADDPEKVFACYCKALSCRSSEDMLVNLRQRMARLLIGRKLFNEARAEIDLLVKARKDAGYGIPAEVADWQGQSWYKSAAAANSNFSLYKTWLSLAESLLYGDVPEESVIVEFVNADKKMLNFIASETKFGFFKYKRFLSDVQIGDTLKVRFQEGTVGGVYKVYTVAKASDPAFEEKFKKEITGLVKIPAGKLYGFIEDVYIHPKLVTKLNLVNGAQHTGVAIRSYNSEKKQWGWKLI